MPASFTTSSTRRRRNFLINRNVACCLLLPFLSPGHHRLWRPSVGGQDSPGRTTAAATTTSEVVAAMRIVVQRVKSASVTVDGGSRTVSSIGPGILGLVGVHEEDTEADLTYCCKRLLGAKLWSNEDGRPWRHGVKQKGYPLLLVSQFTLYGTLSKRNQPDYKLAMKAEPAEELYGRFLAMLGDSYEADKIHDGEFGAMMDVELVNDGPVTIVIESRQQEDSSSEKVTGGGRDEE